MARNEYNTDNTQTRNDGNQTEHVQLSLSLCCWRERITGFFVCSRKNESFVDCSAILNRSLGISHYHTWNERTFHHSFSFSVDGSSSSLLNDTILVALELAWFFFEYSFRLLSHTYSNVLSLSVGQSGTSETVTESKSQSSTLQINRWTVGVTTALAIAATIVAHVFGWGKPA